MIHTLRSLQGSLSLVRFQDFIPTSFQKKCLDKSSNYSEYVGCVFENEKYMEGGTYTAEALRRVRLDDLPMTRDGLTYVSSVIQYAL